ncbi:efflux RND transporter periplasmic adaptor subunit [Noviherbaspirillum sp. CPCC 100848]|uniref:Efflux RND transporter periplasmic adaptor subunit n=1 Tax=Noviherbaspirillum album TaxID=3080276 RepID=A0ABU6JIK2_9BURK|nr:efflux RND transporter periplasmic adaptor subunit [Noviherbaspirillum sp. CPCC 100848]MEC4723012.1 efflux RND transporter periplasmic adaptor subunit [Noviherbaspirillum sp. CPCC 100848]
MLKRRSFWIILAICLLVLLVGGIAAGMLKKPAANTNKAPQAASAAAPAVMEFLPSDVMRVQVGELRRLMPLSGSLRALNQVSVKARVPGDVREVLVREGEAVKPGQVLVRMDASDYQARVGQAQGALAAARGQLDIAAKARDNNRALLDKGFISRNAFDNAASQYDIARANVESARGALDVAQKALADTVIKSPMGGLVSMRSVQPGEKVSADNRLLDVVDLGQMEMEAAVPASEIGSVALGQEVEVRVEGLSKPFPGKVARINPATQSGSRSILVYVQIPNDDNALRVGMFGEAQLVLVRKSGVLTVPRTAIQRDGGQPYVYAIEGGKLTRRTVTLGDDGRSGDSGGVEAFEIAAGLDAGMQIVRTNLGVLRTGTAVKLVGSGNQAAPHAAPAAAAAAAAASASASATTQ